VVLIAEAHLANACVLTGCRNVSNVAAIQHVFAFLEQAVAEHPTLHELGGGVGFLPCCLTLTRRSGDVCTSSGVSGEAYRSLTRVCGAEGQLG